MSLCFYVENESLEKGYEIDLASHYLGCNEARVEPSGCAKVGGQSLLADPHSVAAYPRGWLSVDVWKHMPGFKKFVIILKRITRKSRNCSFTINYHKIIKASSTSEFEKF